MPESLPPASEFEIEWSQKIEPVYRAGKTGNQWKDVDRFTAERLQLSDIGVRTKKASSSGRLANVIVESNDEQEGYYQVLLSDKVTVPQAVARIRKDVARFRNVKLVAVAVCDMASGHAQWRVRALIEKSSVTLAAGLTSHFPAVRPEDIHRVSQQNEVDPDESAVVVTEGEPAEASLEGIGDLVKTFVDFCENRRIHIDTATATDLLACMLSSQFLLFAGPSGTGKSTLSRALGLFFADVERFETVEARRQWVGPEDFVGYYSVLAETYATTPETEKVLKLGEPGASPPILLVEEANLSPIEGYAAPAIHGLSNPVARRLTWPLHGHGAAAANDSETGEVPSSVVWAPFPRVMGTVNVDATAAAPARKVSARACVVLLEPAGALAKDQLFGLQVLGPISGAETEDGIAAEFIGDPSRAWVTADEGQRKATSEALLSLLSILAGKDNANMVSTRDLLRCLMYMSYFQRLVPSLPDQRCREVSAENAVLHFVLPLLAPQQFGLAVQSLLSSGTLTSLEAGGVGGGLKSRLERLRNGLTGVGGFGDDADFWMALS